MKLDLTVLALGRQWAFNLTVLVSSAFGLGLAGSPDYNTFLVMTACVGLGVGGNIPIDTTITLEFIPQVRLEYPLLTQIDTMSNPSVDDS